MKKFRTPFERLTNIDEARVIQVIEVKSLVGEGTKEGSPIRQITEYFSVDGVRLARVDKYLDMSLDELGIWSDEEPHPNNNKEKI